MHKECLNGKWKIAQFYALNHAYFMTVGENVFNLFWCIFVVYILDETVIGSEFDVNKIASKILPKIYFLSCCLCFSTGISFLLSTNLPSKNRRPHFMLCDKCFLIQPPWSASQKALLLPCDFLMDMCENAVSSGFKATTEKQTAQWINFNCSCTRLIAKRKNCDTRKDYWINVIFLFIWCGSFNQFAKSLLLPILSQYNWSINK